MSDEDDLMPLSAIQHFFYCKRQWALIHVERQWVENVLTAEGRLLHDRVDNCKYIERREGYVAERSVPLRSLMLGIYGVADVVEFSPAAKGAKIPGQEGVWLPRPVEYKRGEPKVGICDKAQLCAQAICMEEMYGISIEAGDMFYWQTRRRLPVVFDLDLRAQVNKACEEMHSLFEKGLTPPVPEWVKCKNCSLVDVCLPKIGKSRRKNVAKYIIDNIKQDKT